MLDYVTTSHDGDGQRNVFFATKACVYGHAQAVDAADDAHSGLGGLRGPMFRENITTARPDSPFTASTSLAVCIARRHQRFGE